MRLRAGIVFVVVLAALAAAPQSWAPVYRYAEPASTKGTSNSWWFNFNIPAGAAREYYCFELWSGSTLVRNVGCTAWQAAGTADDIQLPTQTGLTPGVTYDMKVSRYAEGKVKVALSNAMGLGGHNGCVLLGRVDS